MYFWILHEFRMVEAYDFNDDHRLGESAWHEECYIWDGLKVGGCSNETHLRRPRMLCNFVFLFSCRVYYDESQYDAHNLYKVSICNACTCFYIDISTYIYHLIFNKMYYNLTLLLENGQETRKKVGLWYTIFIYNCLDTIDVHKSQ